MVIVFLPPARHRTTLRRAAPVEPSAVASILRSVAATPTLHRLSPELYDRMVDAGLLEGEPVELVDGLLVHVTPQGTEHAALVQRLTRHFGARLDLLRVQMPLAVPGGRPEPDLALAETTARHHPFTAELVVEIAVSTWNDAAAKLPGYAEADVTAAWLVDVRDRAVHVFEQPAGRAYLSERVLRGADELVAPVDGIPSLAVADLFAVLDA
jgi:Uma2 family endonuclease